jgi:hypothetical protein
MLLLALLLLPFALLLAAGIGALAFGAALVGAFFRGPSGPAVGEGKTRPLRGSGPRQAVIDVEYEVKDKDEKGQ